VPTTIREQRIVSERRCSCAGSREIQSAEAPRAAAKTPLSF
jgi:hypothetical protein